MNDYKVTIHQPDFMPWLGFFNKVSKSDELIILDHVTNNPRDSAFWGRRVQILVNGISNWAGVPLVKEKGKISVPINEMIINVDDSSYSKTYKKIRQGYSKAPFYSKVIYLVEQYFENTSNNLSLKNFEFINEVITRLGIEIKISFSSDISSSNSATEGLIELLEKRGAGEYICGQGASGYQKDEEFANHGIKLKFNQYSFPSYNQFNSAEFKSGLSIIDALMNCGFEGTRKLVINE